MEDITYGTGMLSHAARLPCGSVLLRCLSIHKFMTVTPSLFTPRIIRWISERTTTFINRTSLGNSLEETDMSPRPTVTDNSQRSASAFVDRRNYTGESGIPVRERRQFTNSHSELSPEAQEVAQAIDEYKLHHRRRFITYEEMLSVFKSLGYSKG